MSPQDKRRSNEEAFGDDVAQPSRLRVNGASLPRIPPQGETPPELAGGDACATTSGQPTDPRMEKVQTKMPGRLRRGLVLKFPSSLIRISSRRDAPHGFSHQHKCAAQRGGFRAS